MCLANATAAEPGSAAQDAYLRMAQVHATLASVDVLTAQEADHLEYVAARLRQ